MVLIPIPKVPKSAIDPNRPVNALLLAQVMHLREAERTLPAKYHTDIYVNAIRTEREASEYIAAVTGAIHKAHAEAAARRVRKIPKRQRVVQIAAAAEKPKRKAKKKVAQPKPKRKK